MAIFHGDILVSFELQNYTCFHILANFLSSLIYSDYYHILYKIRKRSYTYTEVSAPQK